MSDDKVLTRLHGLYIDGKLVQPLHRTYDAALDHRMQAMHHQDNKGASFEVKDVYLEDDVPIEFEVQVQDPLEERLVEFMVVDTEINIQQNAGVYGVGVPGRNYNRAYITVKLEAPAESFQMGPLREVMRQSVWKVVLGEV